MLPTFEKAELRAASCGAGGVSQGSGRSEEGARDLKGRPPVDGTHALKLALEQQNRAIQRVADMFKKFGDGLLQKEKVG